jgi:hypothetical protein
MENCEGCKYFALKIGETVGQCRHRAPTMRKAWSQIESQIQGENAIWPIVNAQDFCGAWKARPKADQAAPHIKII